MASMFVAETFFFADSSLDLLQFQPVLAADNAFHSIHVLNVHSDRVECFCIRTGHFPQSSHILLFWDEPIRNYLSRFHADQMSEHLHQFKGFYKFLSPAAYSLRFYI